MDAPRYERYSSVPLFRRIAARGDRRIAGVFRRRCFVEPGDVVISEGDIPGHFFIIAEGTLDVIKSGGKNPKVFGEAFPI